MGEKLAQARNQAIYDDLWRYYDVFPHDGWHGWPEIAPFVGEGLALDVGAGKFPRIPIAGNTFVDLSMEALRALRARGGRCVRAALPMPFEDGTFSTVCMFEVLEHVDADRALLSEAFRVLEPGGVLFASCPMNPSYWTYYDRVIGHVRRYRAEELLGRLTEAGFVVERTCARHDRMDGWFGCVFGVGMRYFPKLTSGIVRHYLPKVAALPFSWVDGSSFAEAEARGGLTFRARKP